MWRAFEMAELIRENHISELDSWFAKDNSITPEFLATDEALNTLQDIRRKLEATHEWWYLMNKVNNDGRTTRCVFSISGKLLETMYETFGHKIHNPKSTNRGQIGNDYSTQGTALHEMLAIANFRRHGFYSEDHVMNYFPTYNEASIAPYLLSLNNCRNKSVLDIWTNMQSEERFVKRLVGTEQEWFSRGMPEELLPIFSEDIRPELEIRQSQAVREKALKVGAALFSQPKESKVTGV